MRCSMFIHLKVIQTNLQQGFFDIFVRSVYLRLEMGFLEAEWTEKLTGTRLVLRNRQFPI